MPSVSADRRAGPSRYLVHPVDGVAGTAPDAGGWRLSSSV
jgi:hypothetical protein